MAENTIIKEDNHQQDILIILDKIKHLSSKGVIHLGGHKGEEVEFYRKAGFENIVLVEANPELCSEMQNNFSKEKNISIFNYAICDKIGEIEFHLHESRTGLESSSILKMDSFDKIVTTLKTSKTIVVPAITMDELIQKENIKASNFNVLVSDIQGADYFALKGATQSIKYFDAVVVEVQCHPLYENYVTEKQFDELMFSYGFYKEYVIYHELYQGENRFPAWGEALYLRK